MLRRCAPLVILGLALEGCAEVDRASYVEGETGTATFSNPFSESAYLGGCNRFVQEELVSGAWVDQGGEVVCIVPGPAQPVAPMTSTSEPFGARDPGVWRLTYPVGIGCEEGAPLSSETCDALRTIHSGRFEVIGKDQALCEGTGGRWDPTSCGHYRCGEFPFCDAIIPGCDCGPSSNFQQGEGCQLDPDCVSACGTIVGSTCPDGSTCYDWPADECGLLCAADCLGICGIAAPISCGGFAEIPCPPGSVCVDDPGDRCDPDCGDLDCLGVCIDPSPRGDRCGGIAGLRCPSGEFCEFATGTCGIADLFGTCTPVLDPCVCLQVYDPVCGCDGKTYGNSCEAGCAGISISHAGECEV